MEIVNRRVLCVRGAHLVLIWNKLWLPLESAYPGMLDELREDGRPGQAVMLQGTTDCRALRPLFVETLRLAEREGVTELFALVNPERAQSWGRLGFKDAGWGVRFWDFADYMPVIPLRMPVRVPRRYKGKAVEGARVASEAR